ncbi:nuclear transport factor 2 family protein [Pseudomaricurvus sp.]|uniref:nuclear transport factor 2 family protein n=1 Tax=Pseudomaricurvus sp. TaxID=2004510 RepID=UPI003F6AC836
MNEIERLVAIDHLKQLKAKYFRGVDTFDGGLVKSVLAEDCVLDYRGCFTDPQTGKDYVPALNVVLRGRNAWPSGGNTGLGFVSVHQGHNVEVEFTSDTSAEGIWSMSDRLFFPSGGEYSMATGFGHYHDTYEKVDGKWLLKTTRITRLRVEAV